MASSLKKPKNTSSSSKLSKNTAVSPQHSVDTVLKQFLVSPECSRVVNFLLVKRAQDLEQGALIRQFKLSELVDEGISERAINFLVIASISNAPILDGISINIHETSCKWWQRRESCVTVDISWYPSWNASRRLFFC